MTQPPNRRLVTEDRLLALADTAERTDALDTTGHAAAFDTVQAALATKANASSLAAKADGAATTAALATKAPVASPTLTGTPTAPTAPEADSSTRLATTEYADRATSTLSKTVVTTAQVITNRKNVAQIATHAVAAKAVN